MVDAAGVASTIAAAASSAPKAAATAGRGGAMVGRSAGGVGRAPVDGPREERASRVAGGRRDALCTLWDEGMSRLRRKGGSRGF